MQVGSLEEPTDFRVRRGPAGAVRRLVLSFMPACAEKNQAAFGPLGRCRRPSGFFPTEEMALWPGFVFSGGCRGLENR